MNTEYEKQRKKVDPEFKLLKTLRSRLSSAIKKQSGKKSDTTCRINRLYSDLSKRIFRGKIHRRNDVGKPW